MFSELVSGILVALFVAVPAQSAAAKGFDGSVFASIQPEVAKPVEVPTETLLAELPAENRSERPQMALARVSWYGHGGRTASGERFDPSGLTFAHRALAFGTLVEFCYGGRCVVARCTDRGPYVGGRSFDLSRGAFAALAPLSRGVLTVGWRVVD